MRQKDKKTYATSVVLSILLHLLLLFLIGVFQLLSPEVQAKPESQPIVLEFTQPEEPVAEATPQPEPPQPELPEKLYEVVENPNADEQKPLDGSLLAAQSSRSAAPDITEPGKSQAPKTDFELSNDVSLPDQASSSAEEVPEEALDLDGKIETFLRKNQPRFSKKLLTESKKKDSNSLNNNSTSDTETGYVQQDFEAEFVGDMRFNTYEWDWAPWWLKFREKLIRFWILNVPSMYNRLGLIDGRTYVTIRIDQDGKLMDYKIKKHVGHESLYHSSVGAVEGVFPFKELPPDFPEEYLEINFVMIYPNLRELSEKYPNRFRR